MAQLIRRALLGRAALAAQAVALASPAGAGAPEPHPAWHAEWKALLDWMNGPSCPAVPDVADLPEWGRMQELEGLIVATPAATLAGALAQLRVAFQWGAGYLDEPTRDGFAGALATLDRLAAEGRA